MCLCIYAHEPLRISVYVHLPVCLFAFVTICEGVLRVRVSKRAATARCISRALKVRESYAPDYINAVRGRPLPYAPPQR